MGAGRDSGASSGGAGAAPGGGGAPLSGGAAALSGGAGAVREVLVVGIGVGDPEQLTLEAVSALARVDAVVIVGKERAPELVRCRQKIVRRFAPTARVVVLEDPQRDRAAADYRAAVERWRQQRAAVWERALLEAVPDGGCAAFLAWGEPALYDSTLDVLSRVAARGALRLRIKVIPGISSLQALAARHGVSFAGIGEAIQITTGRRLAERGLPSDAASVLVMLDSECVFARHAHERDLYIWWGAYVGGEQELLISGPLHQVAERIQRERRRARERNGWIMDSYLLRRMPAA